jgi:lipopolysaccharide/colanic/teichoic acid biosynthesis glycosyltransferase
LGIIICFPLLLFIALWVGCSSKGGIFYRQTRVGKDDKDFTLYKFRSMKINSDKQGLLTIGGKDHRITRAGYFLRKHKLDELPQLFNVLCGNMSFVGPRPEVRKYVSLYTNEQMKVLSVRPGITDPASIAYRNENDLLASVKTNPEEYYIKEIMPKKLALNLQYISKRTFFSDILIIFKTIF